MDTLYTFWDNITHYRTESVHFLGLMNSATKGSFGIKGCGDLASGFRIQGWDLRLGWSNSAVGFLMLRIYKRADLRP